MSEHLEVESREALSERCWADIRDLVEQGEISPAFANLVSHDMFENAPGTPPMLRERYWRSYLEEAIGDFSDCRGARTAPWFDPI